MSHLNIFPLQYIKGVGPRLSLLFEKRGVITVYDALLYLPRTYEDRRHIIPLVHLKPGLRQTGQGTISSLKMIPLRNRRQKILECIVTDHTGSISLKWFHGRVEYLEKQAPEGSLVAL